MKSNPPRRKVIITAAAKNDLRGLPREIIDELTEIVRQLAIQFDPRESTCEVDVCISYPVAPDWYRAKLKKPGKRGRMVFSIRRDGLEVSPTGTIFSGDTIQIELCAKRDSKTYWTYLKARVE